MEDSCTLQTCFFTSSKNSLKQNFRRAGWWSTLGFRTYGRVIGSSCLPSSVSCSLSVMNWPPLSSLMAAGSQTDPTLGHSEAVEDRRDVGAVGAHIDYKRILLRVQVRSEERAFVHGEGTAAHLLEYQFHHLQPILLHWDGRLNHHERRLRQVVLHLVLHYVSEVLLHKVRI